jgi:hypothetical protein
VAEPKQTEVSISYSYGIKANMGQSTYESADIHVSRSERWDVTGMTPEEVALHWGRRFEAIQSEVDPLVEAEYAKQSCFARQD